MIPDHNTSEVYASQVSIDLFFVYIPGKTIFGEYFLIMVLGKDDDPSCKPDNF